ncbi:hypothetical protein AOQ84DRAFT_222400 [Glonium stellatum]|uniref:Uncharacterized protein n=1 Tax=Glonium stellatum TaxID=574774 RepID=A0A8E2EZT9_9PEZI|nr:hypothetical protein AOQ84DRAFT_222400 [Glonium stellatum]
MASQLILLDEFLPMNALGLGSLVESLKNPVMDAYMLKRPLPARPLPAEAILSMAAKSFHALLSSKNSTSFRLALTRLLSASYTIHKTSDFSLQSIKVNRYQLKQLKDIFRELYTAEDDTISRSVEKKHRAATDITAPISTTATGGTGVPGVGDALDSGSGVSFPGSRATHKSFILEGESIFAIGYKKIIWKSWGLRRREIDKAILDEEITWSILGQKRGREEEAERVSVDLSDDLSATDDVEAAAVEEGNNTDNVDDVAELLKHGVEVDGQTYLISSIVGKE